jgi:hypothetical protein
LKQLILVKKYLKNAKQKVAQNVAILGATSSFQKVAIGIKK